jgi:AcrR family transcriptional regulator
MAALAAEVNVKVPSLYAHIDGLEALKVELGRRAMWQLGDVSRAAVLGRSGADGLRALTRAYREWALRHPGRYEAQNHPARGDAQTREAAAYAAEALHAVMQSFGVPDADMQFMVISLWATTNGFLSLELRQAFPVTVDADATYEWIVSQVIATAEAVARKPVDRTRAK